MASAAAAAAAPGVALPRSAPLRSAPPRHAKQASRRHAAVSLRLPLAGALSPRRLLSLSVRGRVWIGIVAFALMGIITAQLFVLRLNASIGQSLAMASKLSRENASMAITNSEAGSGEAIEAQARHFGMVALAPGELQFLDAAGPGGAQAAAQALRSTKASSSPGTLGASNSTSFFTPSSGETALTTPTATGGEARPSTTGGEATPSATGGEATGGEAQTSQQPAPSTQVAPAETPSEGQAASAGAVVSGGTQAGAEG